MSVVNEFRLVGHVGKDPEQRTFPDSGDRLTTISLATTEHWRGGEGRDKTEHTDWHLVQFRGELADIVKDHLSTGRQIVVTGRIHQRHYDEGDKRKYVTELRADAFRFLDAKPKEEAQ
jgi:single-strand DNA-binding protein